MRLSDRDPGLRRFERDAVAACLVMAAAAAVLQRGRLDGALVVLAGGLLMGLAYWAIRSSVDVLLGGVAARAAQRAAAAAGGAGEQPRAGEELPGAARSEVPPGGASGLPAPSVLPALSTRQKVLVAVKFIARYALLAVAAYGMLTCLRTHPVGLLVGATSPFVAAAVQVVRMFRAPSHREHL